MITWPDCQACDCGSTQPENLNYSESVLVPDSGLLTQVSNPELYTTKLSQQFANSNWVNTIPLAIATNNLDPSNPLSFKCAKGAVPLYSSIQKQTIPIGERINIFNLKTKYFEGTNKIKVTFASENNLTHHYDNTLTVLATQSFSAGTLLSFVNPDSTTDSNYLWSATTTAGSTVSGINGRLQTNEFTINVEYADPTNPLNGLTTLYTIPANTNVNCVSDITVDVTSLGTITYGDCVGDSNTFNAITLGVQTISNDDCINLGTLGGTATYTLINSGETCQRYVYPSDIEYYQVLTAITISTSTVNGVTVPFVENSANTGGFFQGVLQQTSIIENYTERFIPYPPNSKTLENTVNLTPTSYFDGFTEQVILILQRGVDPYSPKIPNKYSIGTLFGTNESDSNWTFTANTRLNVPIQKVPTGSQTFTPQHNVQNNISNHISLLQVLLAQQRQDYSSLLIRQVMLGTMAR
jgi:hypothetical protein